MVKQITLHAPDIGCNHCAMTIKRELGQLAGVKVVDVDVAGKTVTLEYADEAALTQAKATLAEVGYPVAS